MREQRLVFVAVAELYDRARAAYSEAVIDDVLRFAGGDGSRLRALEVGAGTGKATVAFAVRGLAIVAIEPSAAMAVVARRNCKPFPNVRLECTTFEDWAVEANPFDLVFSAQAWHWVTPEVRYVKAAEALAGGGTLALFWHRTRWQGEDLRAELEDLYRRLVPELYAKDPGFPGLTQPRGTIGWSTRSRDQGCSGSRRCMTTRGQPPSPQTRSWSSCSLSRTTAYSPRTRGPNSSRRYAAS
jgi:SAM-dependent methyltransferase